MLALVAFILLAYIASLFYVYKQKKNSLYYALILTAFFVFGWVLMDQIRPSLAKKEGLGTYPSYNPIALTDTQFGTQNIKVNSIQIGDWSIQQNSQGYLTFVKTNTSANVQSTHENVPAGAGFIAMSEQGNIWLNQNDNGRGWCTGKISEAKTAADAAQSKANEAHTKATDANNNANGRVSRSGDTMNGQLSTPKLIIQCNWKNWIFEQGNREDWGDAGDSYKDEGGRHFTPTLYIHQQDRKGSFVRPRDDYQDVL